ncbi:hypothetical protein LX99_04666 [Mucilaginibacter oryzae]|uniref:SWIM-type domain-containing protein n=1 Tax=Mucilaginibacter oryzae TaxID=468058 RepID=A0A316GYL1_9SPHI|nr:hypothetical protein [Mucilaginibacter oryzae]PWK70013.1 hypothetical protein LX99_04666 [Mucilaginibacter oryzae]
MELTFKNYTKELPKELLQQAEKNTVRECDENEGGQFIAYVDEGNDSFDVSVTRLPGDKIGDHSCDCGSNLNFCRHKVALINHLAKNKKVKATVKLKKQKSSVEALMEDIDFGMLKEWVANLIQKNKDIELAFVHHFSAGDKEYKPEDVVNLVNDAVKASGCNKKNVDATQIKKLVELWTEVLRPVIDNYLLGVMDEKAFQNLHTMLDHCYQVQSKTNSGSTRIHKYVGTVLKNAEDTVNNLQNDEAWHRAVGFFRDHLFVDKYNIRLHYLIHLQNIINKADEARRQSLIKSLIAQYKRVNTELLGSGLYTKLIFGFIEANNLFPEYYNVVKPIRFDNEFNEHLIRLLIENNHLETAEKYCREQIKSNFREEYNRLYWGFLKEIYTLQGNEKKLADVLLQLFPLEYNFDDYIFISNRLPDDERKKWRTRMLTNARHASYSFGPAMTFCFKLMDHEKNYKKMLDYIEAHTPYSLILKYSEPMLAAGKNKLLEILSQKTDYSWGVSAKSKKDDEESFPALFELLKMHYGDQYLTLVVKQIESNRYKTLNRFFKYVKEQLLPVKSK